VGEGGRRLNKDARSIKSAADVKKEGKENLASKGIGESSRVKHSVLTNRGSGWGPVDPWSEGCAGQKEWTKEECVETVGTRTSTVGHRCNRQMGKNPGAREQRWEKKGKGPSKKRQRNGGGQTGFVTPAMGE